MPAPTHTMPTIPPAPKRAERASLRKDMASLASVVKKFASKQSPPLDEKVEKITIMISKKI